MVDRKRGSEVPYFQNDLVDLNQFLFQTVEDTLAFPPTIDGDRVQMVEPRLEALGPRDQILLRWRRSACPRLLECLAAVTCLIVSGPRSTDIRAVNGKLLLEGRDVGLQ